VRTLVVDAAADTVPPAAPVVAAQDPAAPEVAGPRRPVVARGRPLAEFDESEKALLDEAAALVRSVVEQAVAEVSLTESPSLDRVKRTGVRTVQRQVRAWRNEPASSGTRLGKRKSAKLARVYSVLFDFAMSDGSIPGTLRWPDGVDVADALAELIRVLSAAPYAAGSRLPGIAEGDAAPQVASERLPEFE